MIQTNEYEDVQSKNKKNSTPDSTNNLPLSRLKQETDRQALDMYYKLPFFSGFIEGTFCGYFTCSNNQSTWTVSAL